MGLYTSFSTTKYRNKPKKHIIEEESKQEEAPIIKENIKKSLYAEAQKVIKETKNKPSVNFKEQYVVGQLVAIQGPNGIFRTRKGRINEIVAEDLMYVLMEDSYKDSTDEWLADFVTGVDKIHLL